MAGGAHQHSINDIDGLAGHTHVPADIINLERYVQQLVDERLDEVYVVTDRPVEGDGRSGGWKRGNPPGGDFVPAGSVG